MLKKRLIAVIIVRDGQVVQSVKFKHTNIIHYDAIHAVETFNRWSIDEIAFINVSKSNESSKHFLEIVKHISKECFVPLTVGGWITDYNYACELFSNGADKILLNSAFSDNPDLIRKLASKFGSQAIVASIDIDDINEIKRVVVNRGSHNINVSPEEWALHCEKLGAGEIFFNSVQHDGARKGYDLESLSNVCSNVTIPVIAFGGAFNWSHFVEGFENGADAVAAANIFHYTEHSTKKAKRYLNKNGIPIRMEGI